MQVDWSKSTNSMVDFGMIIEELRPLRSEPTNSCLRFFLISSNSWFRDYIFLKIKYINIISRLRRIFCITFLVVSALQAVKNLILSRAMFVWGSICFWKSEPMFSRGSIFCKSQPMFFEVFYFLKSRPNLYLGFYFFEIWAKSWPKGSIFTKIFGRLRRPFLDSFL